MRPMLQRISQTCMIGGMADAYELTILMPCLNEAETLGRCIDKAQSFLARSGIKGEVLIADNGSTDGSREIARSRGARVIAVSPKGYGSAVFAGICDARGKYVIIGDSDDSYDFNALDPFVEKLRAGCQLVMGNRFRGGILPGAMPPLHRYLGNPVLTIIGRIFFRSPCGDFHCGLRGFDRDAILALDLQAPGMEFASEMVIKATIRGLRIAEVPTTLSPHGRSRPPHLRTWHDGWRHLRFLLLFSPRWLFLYPGAALLVAGTMGMLWLVPQPRLIGSVTLDVHTLVYCAIAVVIGFQSMLFGIFTKIYGIKEGLLPHDPRIDSFVKVVTLEIGLIAGLFCLALGACLTIYAVGFWGAEGFGSMRPQHLMRIVIPAAALVLLGFQAIYGAFFITILEIRSCHNGSERLSSGA
jgi:glycosyltransferase involved in cell wall biosynthesis